MGYNREYCGGGGGGGQIETFVRKVCLKYHRKSMSVKRLKQMGVIAGTQ